MIAVVDAIGTGRRGLGAHMPGVHAHAEAENVQITAVCDVWRRYLQQAAAKTEDLYHMHALKTLEDVRTLAGPSGGYKAFQELKDALDLRSSSATKRAAWGRRRAG